MQTSRAVCWLLSATLVCVLGCIAPKPPPNPLAGWKTVWKEQPDQTIEKDFEQYVHSLTSEERIASSRSSFLEDGAGQHAVVLEVALKGRWWHHVLIYDKDNKRVKTIKYSPGRYRS